MLKNVFSALDLHGKASNTAANPCANKKTGKAPYGAEIAQMGTAPKGAFFLCNQQFFRQSRQSCSKGGKNILISSFAPLCLRHFRQIERYDFVHY